MEAISIFSLPVLMLAGAISLAFSHRTGAFPLAGAAFACGLLHIARATSEALTANADLLLGLFLTGMALYVLARQKRHAAFARAIAKYTGLAVGGGYIFILSGAENAGNPAALTFILISISLAASGAIGSNNSLRGRR